MRNARLGPVWIGLTALKPKATPLFSSPSSSAAAISCPSSPPYLTPKNLVFSLIIFSQVIEKKNKNKNLIVNGANENNCFSLFYVLALFQSLLYEACGRTVNPVSGAVGLLSTGNWHACLAAVETVLAGGELRPMYGIGISSLELEEPSSERFRNGSWRAKKKSKEFSVHGSDDEMMIEADRKMYPAWDTENSELSASFGSGGCCYDGVEMNGVVGGKEPKLLNLFV